MKSVESLPKVTRMLAALVSGALAVTQAHGTPNPVRYACPASADLAVQRSGSTASVNYAGRRYELQRKRSSVGAKYVSPNAALIIDGNSAIFVAEDVIDLGTCTKTVSVASSR